MHRLLASILAVLLSTCGGVVLAQPDVKGSGEVVIYTALDRQYSEPILKQFEEATGIEVRPVYDTEAAKTVGLVNRLMAERDRPKCDVFWNNEILRSIQLKREGLTAPYVSPSAADIPASFKDAEITVAHVVTFGARPPRPCFLCS